MELKQKAREYATSKAVEFLTETIARAYEDGFRDGYNSKDKDDVLVLKKYEGRFIDLGLPSGTLWSEDYLSEDGKRICLPFNDAFQYSIPSPEQWNELRNLCEWAVSYTTSEFSGKVLCVKARCTGPNGQSLEFKLASANEALFWLQHKYHSTAEQTKEMGAVGKIIVRSLGVKCSETTSFIGNSQFLRLVKTRSH